MPPGVKKSWRVPLKTEKRRPEEGIMSVNSIASLSTAMAATQTNQEIGVAMLKKSIDIASNSELALLSSVSAPTPAANLPSNLGQNINTTA